MHRLDEVVDTLLVLQKKHRIRFDVWQVVKRDHAIISFFDQGMNPAVPRVAYWTPFRYPLLLNLASLFDNELAEKAWRARLEAHDGRSSSLFIDRNLNPKKIKKTPKNGCLFNTACVP